MRVPSLLASVSYRPLASNSSGARSATDSLPVHKNNRLEASMHLRRLRQKKLQRHVVYAQR